MPVALANEQSHVQIDLRRLTRVAEELLSASDCSEAELSVLLVDDKRMAQLNRRWMHRHGPTDVLSFPQLTTAATRLGRLTRRVGGSQDARSSPNPPVVLGDVAISMQTAARRCPKDPFQEAVRYLIHGLLHLLGYDHATKAQARRMNQEAARLLKKVTLNPRVTLKR